MTLQHAHHPQEERAMGRRPAGTGPRREGPGLGLVAYHSDEDEEQQQGPQRSVVRKRAAATDAASDAAVAAAAAVDAGQRNGEAVGDDVEEERKRAQQAAAEAEDLFKSLETEMQGGGGGADAPSTNQEQEGGAAAESAAVVVIPPVDLPVLSAAELKKLTAGKPEAEAQALRGELQRLWEDVNELQGESALWRAEAVRLAARVQDWRDGLLPSSSLVRRAKEAVAVLDAEEAEWKGKFERAFQYAIAKHTADAAATAEGKAVASKKKGKGKTAAAAPAAEEEAAAPSSNGGEANAGLFISVPEAPPLPPLPPPPAEPEPSEEDKKKKEKEAAAAAEKAAPGEWTAVWDETYQGTYWYNTKTGATTWEPPAGVKAAKPAAGNGSTTTTTAAAAAPAPANVNATVRDVSSPIPVTAVGGDALLLFNGERPLVRDAEGVIRLFAGAGPRQVRDLGAGYFCVAFGRPGGAAKGLRLASTVSDKPAAIQRAASDWVEGTRGTFIRFVLPHDEPDRLTQVPVAASEEGADEEYVSVQQEEGGSSAEAGAAPAVVAGGKVVVGRVVAKAPSLRRKRPTPAEKGEGGEGDEGSKKVKA